MLRVLLDAGGVLAAIVMLWKGADWFVASAVRIARRFHVSDLVIGLTLVALGTSAPEFAVSVGAAATGRGDIAVSNVVGSNIFNLGFILGGCALIRTIGATRTLVYRDGSFLVLITLVLAFFVRDLQISRVEGSIFLLALVSYIGYLLSHRKGVDLEPDHGDAATWVDPFVLLGALAIVLLGAQLLVTCAAGLARQVGMSEWAIGVTIVAAGTSAPELVTSLTAVLKGRHAIGAGNLLGSDLFNLMGVLGLSALVEPVRISANAPSSVLALICVVVLVVVFLRTGWRLTRVEGAVLVGINAARWYFEVASRAA